MAADERDARSDRLVRELLQHRIDAAYVDQLLETIRGQLHEAFREGQRLELRDDDLLFNPAVGEFVPSTTQYAEVDQGAAGDLEPYPRDGPQAP